MSMPYTAPKHKKTAFNCPICGAYSDQRWYHGVKQGWGQSTHVEGLEIVMCAHCQKHAVWLEERMLYPAAGTAPLPNPDLPEEIKRDYEEARSIVSLSPRGAAALLRLAIQRLCKHLGEKGENLNDDISNLVSKGLPPKIQKALDIVRVIGNNAVHPGQIDLKDDAGTVAKLFGLVNLIAEVMITQPKQIDDLYEGLPEGQKASIGKRDNEKK